MLVILKTIKTVNSGLLRFKLQMKWDPFSKLTLFDMGGGMMAPQNVFDHCAQMLRRKKLKLGDF